MARTPLATTTITAAGVAPALTAANVDGHSIDQNRILHVKNGSGASINVTIETGQTAGDLAIADRVIAVPAGQERLIHVAGESIYPQPGPTDAGKVYVNFSTIASVTVAAYALP